MGDNLRRVYIYPALPEDDGRAPNPFWSPGKTGLVESPDDQPQSASSNPLDDYFIQGGGLLGMLLRGMQQDRMQPDVDSGSTPNRANINGNSAGALLGRLLAGQSGLRPFAVNNERTPSEPPDPDFREVSRARVAARPQDAMANPSGDQSTPSYALAGGDVSLDRIRAARQSDFATQPERTFSDRLQAYWDHPHPHGVVSMLKDGLNGMAQAVQGSIDANIVPSTEEEAFRQNLGREQGPIGAWRGVSLLNPKAPRGTGGIFARPLADAIANHGLLPQAVIADKIATPRSIVPLNHTPAPPRTSGGLLGPYSDRSALPWIAAAPSIQAGISEVQAGRKRYRKLPKNVDLLKWFAEQDKKAPSAQGWQTSYGGYGGGRGNGNGNGGDGSPRKVGDGYDCYDRFDDELKRCGERYPDYAHTHYFGACKERAQIRRNMCTANGGVPDPTENKEWDLADEETFRRDFQLPKS